jgi:hypothetical protein
MSHARALQWMVKHLQDQDVPYLLCCCAADLQPMRMALHVR